MHLFVDNAVEVTTAHQRLYRFLVGRGIKFNLNYTSTQKKAPAFPMGYVEDLGHLRLECGMRWEASGYADKTINADVECEAGFVLTCIEPTEEARLSWIQASYNPLRKGSDKVWSFGSSVRPSPSKELQNLIKDFGLDHRRGLPESDAFEIIGALTTYFINQRPAT